jgi:hypothetical protein
MSHAQRATGAVRVAWVAWVAAACSTPAIPAQPPTVERAFEPTPAPFEFPKSTVALRSDTCGELVLALAAGRERGWGERHPERLAVEQGILVRCKDDDGTSMVKACARVRLAALEESTRYGPRHPIMRERSAQLALCPATTP